MELILFLKGMGLGLAIAAPVGPIGLLCIRRTLSYGQRMGLASGLGAATADGFYGCIAGFGLTAISQLLVNQVRWLQMLGGLFLGYLGIKTFFSTVATEPAEVSSQGLLGAYGSTFILTLTNPATILSFIAIFASLGIANPGTGRLGSALIVFGVFLGSSLWWVFLSWGVNLFRVRLTLQRLGWLNKLAGIAIFVFGIVALGLSK